MTDYAAYPASLEGFDVAESEFRRELTADESRKAAWADFAEARELGVAGFPAVRLQLDDGIQVLSRGRAGADNFDSALPHWVYGPSRPLQTGGVPPAFHAGIDPFGGTKRPFLVYSGDR